MVVVVVVVVCLGGGMGAPCVVPQEEVVPGSAGSVNWYEIKMSAGGASAPAARLRLPPPRASRPSGRGSAL